MSPHAEDSSARHPRRLTIAVVLLVAASITLANLSSEPVTPELIKRIVSKPARAYGWPLTWYWREASTVAGSVPPWNSVPPRPEVVWPVARYSTSGLIANLPIWLVLLAGPAAACVRLLRKYQRRLPWRPRMTMLIVALAAAAPTVMANMTFDMAYVLPRGAFGKASYGWPFVWHWYWVAPIENVYGRDFSAARLAANTAIWFGMVVLAAFIWEWLLRRRQPRLRFSLRTMMAAVAVVAILWAWCVSVWNRADEQDALAASSLVVGRLWVERPGPKWLRLVLPDRFRRRVVGASISIWLDKEDDDQYANSDVEGARDGKQWDGETDKEPSHADDELLSEEDDVPIGEVLQRLARLSALRYLDISYDVLTPAMSDALGKLEQLRSLHVGLPFLIHPARTTNLAWVGRLRRLEQLSLEQVASDELGCLANLTHLKSLSLDLTDCKDDESEMDKRLAAVAKLMQLRRLRLQGSPGAQISHLSGLTNLKSLSLEFHHFDHDQERLHQCFAAIGKLTQVEELRLAAAFNVYTNPDGALRIRADNLASLGGMTNLRSLWLVLVSCRKCDTSERRACLAAIAKLTQLRRLWLAGDLVTTGVAELAPLESLEELEISDEGMYKPTAIESLSALKSLKAVHIPGLAFDFYSSEEGAAAHRALKSFQRSHAGRVSNLWLKEHSDLMPWGAWEEFNERIPDLDTFLGGNPGGP